MLTATKQLFSSNKNINYWQFVVIYTDENKYGSGSIQRMEIQINYLLLLVKIGRISMELKIIFYMVIMNSLF